MVTKEINQKMNVREYQGGIMGDEYQEQINENEEEDFLGVKRERQRQNNKCFICKVCYKIYRSKENWSLHYQNIHFLLPRHTIINKHKLTILKQ